MSRLSVLSHSLMLSSLSLSSVFLQCGCYQEAFAAFERAGSWELMFVSSSQLQHTPAQRMEAARKMASELLVGKGAALHTPSIKYPVFLEDC